MNKCLFCYQPLDDYQKDFHVFCSKNIFGMPSAPIFPYSEGDLEPLAIQVIQSQTAVTGVQAKLSLHITSDKKEGLPKRFTVVGLWGDYILKLPTPNYPQLPEVEDLTMHLASLAKIKTAPHSLIRMESGSLAYITKRLDRTRKGKLAMEDMCQLSQRLTEDKYRGSYEQIGKTIQRYSATVGLDLVNFFELILFSFLTGNADMHLKNFSLLEQPGLGMVLSPAYDLVNTSLVNPADDEEMALTLNGKKKKLKRMDFIFAMNSLNITEKQQSNIFSKMEKAIPLWIKKIADSFLNQESKNQYQDIILKRINQLK